MKILSKTIQIIIVILLTYFLGRWIGGDLSSLPISEYTMRDIGNFIMVAGISLIAIRVIADIASRND